ncbi:MAG TPA: hypothetical protein VE195_09630 [Acidobacteriaceae bacterium]|nr:hypothetical protein [Acidobacteriaceae bacterium]
MRSTNHKYPTRSGLNGYDFVAFGNQSASVLEQCNAARFDGELSANAQTAPAETTPSSRAIATPQRGRMQIEPGLATTVYPVTNAGDVAGETGFICPATLFDSVMDFLDRYDWMVAQQRSSKGQNEAKPLEH